MYSSDDIRRMYESFAPKYDRMVAPVEAVYLARRRRQLLKRAKGSVLEVAVGTGRNLPYYPADCHVTGIDISPEMLGLARARAQQRSPNKTSLLIGDALNLPFADHSFDTVASTLSTCTFPDPIKALSEIRRVCSADGLILLLEHGRSSWRWLGRIQDRRFHGHAAMTGCFMNRDPLALAKRAGLQLQSVRKSMAGMVVEIVARP